MTDSMVINDSVHFIDYVMSKIIWESKLKELRQNQGKASVAKPIQFEGQNLQVCMRKYRVLNLMCLLSVHFTTLSLCWPAYCGTAG